MRAAPAVLLLAALAAAAAGVAVPGLFWLVPVALAGLMATGSWAVSRHLRRADGPTAGEPQTVTRLPVVRGQGSTRSSEEVGTPRRAA